LKYPFLCGEKIGKNEAAIMKFVHGKDKKGKKQEGGGGGNNLYKLLILFSTFSLSYPLKTTSFHLTRLIYSLFSPALLTLMIFSYFHCGLSSFRCCNNPGKNLMLCFSTFIRWSRHPQLHCNFARFSGLLAA
jgi:hypothetical protein